VFYLKLLAVILFIRISGFEVFTFINTALHILGTVNTSQEDSRWFVLIIYGDHSKPAVFSQYSAHFCVLKLNYY